MTARKPKPVRAWAETVSATDRRIACDEWGHIFVAKTRRRCIDDAADEDARPLRVTIVPDGTPSQAAEVRRLRRLLRIALCAAENYIAAMEPHEGECDEPEDQAVIWHARKHVAEVKAALRGGRGR